MTTINISLPDKLKEQADDLVRGGYYASFSDLVRHSLRQTIEGKDYDQWFREAVSDFQAGKIKSLKNEEDIDRFIDAL